MLIIFWAPPEKGTTLYTKSLLLKIFGTSSCTSSKGYRCDRWRKSVNNQAFPLSEIKFTSK